MESSFQLKAFIYFQKQQITFHSSCLDRIDFYMNLNPIVLEINLDYNEMEIKLKEMIV